MALYSSKLVGSAFVHVDAVTMKRIDERFPKGGDVLARDWVRQTLNAQLDVLDAADDQSD